MEISDLLDHIHELPPGARVLPRLQRLLRADDASSDDIIKLLKVDASLTAQILRFSNSAYFSAGMPCESVDQALQRLGFNTVYQLVATAAAQPLLDPPMQVYKLQKGELMTRSLALGLFSLEINKLLRLPDSDDALYTAGLLHGIGKVAINQYFQRKGFEIYDLNNDQPMSAELEMRLIGFTHSAAGAALLEHWHFSNAIISLVGHQLEPELSPEHKDLARVIHFGLRSLDVVLDEKKDAAILGHDPYGTETLGLSPEGLTGIVERVRVALNEIARQF